MRALVLTTSMLAPALAAANPCEDLAQAICPSKGAMGECVNFLDRELRTPDGKSLAGMTRLNACKEALGDVATLEDYKAGVRGKPRAARWYTMQVMVEPRKLDGTPWDADGGPDVAVCLEVDEKAAGCLPDGAERGAVSRPACKDAARCELRFEAKRGAMVTVEVMDLDDEGSDLIGVCAFTAGGGAAQCEGPLSLTTEGAGAAAGRVVDRRIVGRWVVDVDRTLARSPGGDRGKLGMSWFEFGEDGRLVAAVGEEQREGRYAITGLKGSTLTLAVTGELAGAMEVMVGDDGLELREGSRVTVLRRAP